MKKSVSPGVVVLIIAILVIVIGMVYMKGGGTGAKAKQMEDAIQSTVVSGKGNIPSNVTPQGGAAPVAPAKTE